MLLTSPVYCLVLVECLFNMYMLYFYFAYTVMSFYTTLFIVFCIIFILFVQDLCDSYVTNPSHDCSNIHWSIPVFESLGSTINQSINQTYTNYGTN